MKIFTSLFLFVAISIAANSQTPGQLSFSFNALSHTSYSGTKSVMAVWIQTSTGAFVKTGLRNVGNGTKDHLQTWALNSGGSATNALSASCNVVSATTGATFTSFGTHSVVWDGTDVNGVIVADGTYKITIEETWNHGTSNTVVRSFTFQKGPNSDIQSPTTDANFDGISLNWTATSSADVKKNNLDAVSISPNPSKDGLFVIDYKLASSITVYNMLGVMVLPEQLKAGDTGKKTLDLSENANGVYLVRIKDGTQVRNYRVVVNK